MSICGICFELFSATPEDDARLPVVAPCGHTCCLGCARSLHCCAFCRSPFPADPAALPRNYQLLEALESVPAPETAASSASSLWADGGSGERQGALPSGSSRLGRSIHQALVIPPGDLTLTSTVLGMGGTGKVVLGEYQGRQVGAMCCMCRRQLRSVAAHVCDEICFGSGLHSVLAVVPYSP